MAIKDSMLVKTWSFVRKYPQHFLYMLFFDILFIIAAYYTLIVGERFIFKGIISGIIITAIFVLLIVLEYSFFKFLVLNQIRNIFKKNELDFNHFKRFYTLSAVILVPVFVAFVIINTLSIRLLGVNVFSALLLVLIFFVIIIYAYAVVSISNSIFSKKGLIPLILDSLKLSLKPSNYIKIYLNGLLLLFIYFILWLIIKISMKSFTFSAYLEYYSVYRLVIITLAIVTLYATIVVSRVNFFKEYNNLK